MRRKISDKALRNDVNGNNSLKLSVAALDAFPAAEMECLVPRIEKSLWILEVRFYG